MILNAPYYSQFRDTKKSDWKSRSCGITALKMVLDYYKTGNPDIDDLFQKGLDLKGYLENVGWYHHSLVNIAQSLGFKGITRSWNIPSKNLPKLKERGFRDEDLQIMEDQLLQEGLFTFKQELGANHPVIVSIPRNFKKTGSGHLVVLIGFDEEGFYINDPDDEEKSGEKIKLSYKDFSEVWAKRAIFIYQ